jgi:hypothetical protein
MAMVLDVIRGNFRSHQLHFGSRCGSGLLTDPTNYNTEFLLVSHDSGGASYGMGGGSTLGLVAREEAL